MPEARPSTSWHPPGDHDTAAYWAGCAQRMLMIARCRDCGRWQHPPRAVCPACWSETMVAEPVSGAATIFSFTLARDAQTGAGVATVWAELSEQPRLILVADLTGDASFAQPAIGDPLLLDWRPFGDGYVPLFRPAPSP